MLLGSWTSPSMPEHRRGRFAERPRAPVPPKGNRCGPPGMPVRGSSDGEDLSGVRLVAGHRRADLPDRARNSAAPETVPGLVDRPTQRRCRYRGSATRAGRAPSRARRSPRPAARHPPMRARAAARPRGQRTLLISVLAWPSADQRLSAPWTSRRRCRRGWVPATDIPTWFLWLIGAFIPVVTPVVGFTTVTVNARTSRREEAISVRLWSAVVVSGFCSAVLFNCRRVRRGFDPRPPAATSARAPAARWRPATARCVRGPGCRGGPSGCPAPARQGE